MCARSVSSKSSPTKVRRCDTRPVSVTTITSIRPPPSCTSSTWVTFARANDGYWTIATWPVSCVSARTVRTSTSSRSPEPSRNEAMAERCAEESGRISARWSTKTR